MGFTNEVRIINFYVFNPNYGTSENNEYEKIFYYYPVNVIPEIKMRDVGLSHALTFFTSTFTNSACECLHTYKTCQVYLKAELNFWFVLTVGIPYIEKEHNGTITYEYKENRVSDSIYKSILTLSYQLFRLFHGSIDFILSKTDLKGLKIKFDIFFTKYFDMMNIEKADVMSVFNGVHFLPLSQHRFLKVRSFINRLEFTFPQIKETIFIYNSQLVWNGVEPKLMRLLYNFILSLVIPNENESNFRTETINSPIITRSFSTSNFNYVPKVGKFLIGPKDLTKEKFEIIPILHYENQKNHFFAVYRLYEAIIGILIDGSIDLEIDFFRQVDAYMHANLEPLASDMASLFTSNSLTNNADSPAKYVYFNLSNFAQKTSIHSHNKSNCNLSPDIMSIVSNINDDLLKSEYNEECEIIVNLEEDYWIVGKKSHQREIVIVALQKQANIVIANAEAKKICALNLSNSLFID